MQTRQMQNSFPCPNAGYREFRETGGLQARGEVGEKGKNKQKKQQQQQKRGETAKIRLQSEPRDGLAGLTRRLCFFLRPYPIFLSPNFSPQCGACPRLPRPSLVRCCAVLAPK